MKITSEWLDSVADDKGLTRGQTKLLGIHTRGAPYVGQEIPDAVAHAIEQCRGYRGMSEESKALVREA
jgi:hypothetical protein